MAEPVVTTVIPTYRRPQLLERAIRSAQEQTYPHIRIRVYDNASHDETESVVRRLAASDPRIEYHCHDTNIGLLGNYNYGMSHADTELFSFLADDDTLCARFYEEAVATLRNHPTAMFFAARTLIDNQSVGVKQLSATSWRAGLQQPGRDAALHMLRESFIGTSCVFRREILQTIGVFDAAASDRNYLIVAATKHPFIVSESAVVKFVIHRQSFSGGGVRDEEAPMVLNGAYVAGLYEALEARLREHGAWDDVIAAEVRRDLRRDVRWALLTKSFRTRNRRDLADIAQHRTRFGLSRIDASIVRLLNLLVRIRPLHAVASWSLAFAHRALLKRREPRTWECGAF